MQTKSQRYHNGPLPGATPPVSYSGWVDAETREAVSYWDVKARYEQRILAHCGMRILDPSVLDGFDGANTTM